MLLTDVLNHLATGELEFLKVGGHNLESPSTESMESIIKEEDIPKVVRNIQLGITELYKKFKLKEACYTLTLEEDKCIYVIPATDIIQIEYIKEADGTLITFNRNHDINSIRAMSYNTLLVPDTLARQDLQVTYRANHPTIDLEVAISSPESIILELPITHLKPLILYTASKIFTPRGASDGFHAGNDYYMKYIEACNELTDKNYSIDSIGQENKFNNNGWV